MNIKRTTTSAALVLMALSLVSVAFPGAYAQQTQGMSITATANEGSDTITISGKTTSTLNDVTLVITAPNLLRVQELGQVTPDANGEFEETFNVSTWKVDGLYSIKAKQADNSLYTLEILVEVINGATVQTDITESNLPKGILVDGPNVAQNQGLTMDIVAIIDTTEIMVSGTTDRLSEDITLLVTTPNGNRVTTAQVSPELDGTYYDVITTGGALWTQNGFYTVTAQQNDDPLYQASHQVDIKDGVIVPEFGAIAAMILAVAIISVIAVSSRSRLSIMPRY